MWVRLPPPALVAGLLLAALALAACGGASAPDVTTTSGNALTVVEVAGGLDRPVSLTGDPAEPGRLYVVGQAGVIRVLEGGAVSPEPFLDIHELVLTSPKGEFASERGLLSLAFAPDYPASGRFYVFYTERSGADVIAAYRARGGVADPESAQILLRIPNRSTRHHGGQLHIGPEGRLYVSVGDDLQRSGDPQSLDGGDPYGKILALRGDGAWEPVAYGLRNPWRWSFDRETGDLWIGDVGENAWEEVNRLAAGSGIANLGWPVYEGLHRWGQGEPNQAGELAWPVAEYSHATGCSVTGGYVYRGQAIPELAGRYVYGDYCTGTVWSLAPDDPGEVREELRLGVTLASFGEGAGGELYLVSRTGRVFQLVRSD